MLSKKKILNRRANEKSPYLLQHANNLVDWYPWGEEAFEKAKREDKPIFLSIGYSWLTCIDVLVIDGTINYATYYFGYDGNINAYVGMKMKQGTLIAQ